MKRAMIFAAGIGSRLKPFTDHHPKALAPVGGIPMLGRVINKLKDFGIKEIIVNVHHFADQIESYLQTNHNFGVDILISDERKLLLDTGGGLLHAAKQLRDSDILVLHNADIYTDFDLSGLLDGHISTNALATLLVASRDTQRYLLFDDNNRMMGWTNLSTGQLRPVGISNDGYKHLAFGGVHSVDAFHIFDLLDRYNDSLLGLEPDRESLDGVCKFSIMDFYIDLCHEQIIRGYQPAEEYRWVDIGKAEKLQHANDLFTT